MYNPTVIHSLAHGLVLDSLAKGHRIEFCLSHSFLLLAVVNTDCCCIIFLTSNVHSHTQKLHIFLKIYYHASLQSSK
jgi:hypothetical protein